MAMEVITERQAIKLELHNFARIDVTPDLHVIMCINCLENRDNLDQKEPCEAHETARKIVQGASHLHADALIENARKHHINKYQTFYSTKGQKL